MKCVCVCVCVVCVLYALVMHVFCLVKVLAEKVGGNVVTTEPCTAGVVWRGVVARGNRASVCQ